MSVTRTELLAKVRLVLAQRQVDHGEAVEYLQTFAGLVSVLLDRPVSLLQADLILVAMKLARVKCKPGHPDNWIDLIGYTAIGGEVASQPEKREGT